MQHPGNIAAALCHLKINDMPFSNVSRVSRCFWVRHGFLVTVYALIMEPMYIKFHIKQHIGSRSENFVASLNEWWLVWQAKQVNILSLHVSVYMCISSKFCQAFAITAYQSAKTHDPVTRKRQKSSTFSAPCHVLLSDLTRRREKCYLSCEWMKWCMPSRT